MTKRRFLSCVIATFFMATVPLVDAQQSPKIPRLGFLPVTGSPSAPGALVEAFRQGLRDLGYIEGTNIHVEYRWPLGRLDQVPLMVAELVQLNVDVLVIGLQPGINAARKITKTIPIVMISSVDPVAAGHVNSLARPGGNVTGLAILMRELSAKRVELAKDILPRMTRIGILWDPQGPGPVVAFKEYQAAAREFKLDLQSLEVRAPNPDLEGLFKAAKEASRDALVVISNPLIRFHQTGIVELASRKRLPSLYEDRVHVEAGGLLSYGASNSDVYRRAAYYVDRILKGAKPPELPVEQPTKFELVINLKTAKQIGLTIPPNVLARADRVIR
jgi:putative tryptophan/tyrosine transport system substrate-binding protein